MPETRYHYTAFLIAGIYNQRKEFATKEEAIYSMLKDKKDSTCYREIGPIYKQVTTKVRGLHEYSLR